MHSRSRHTAEQHPFEDALAVSACDLKIELCGQPALSWEDFLLNPRRLRGSDFLMRWSQGMWSEERLIQAVAETGRYFALPYGPSGTAPGDDVRAFELYFERLEAAGLGKLKRPDLLVFRSEEAGPVTQVVQQLGGESELPFTSENDPRMRQLQAMAILAVECENSLWMARRMPNYGSVLTPQRRLGGQLGLKKSAVLPTVILKQEDREFLLAWQSQHSVSIHIWHAFYDLAFGISLDDAQDLIEQGKIEPTVQVFQAPGGATTRKTIYKFYYHYAYPLGETEGEIQLVADSITDNNGHILPYVRFQGGHLRLTPEAVQILDQSANRWQGNR